jgi:hypothetical protein
MLTLYHGSGSGRFRIGAPNHTGDAWTTLRTTASKLLAMRGYPEAATFLTKYPFIVHTGENDLGDEFSVLYADVSLPEYVVDELRREPADENDFCGQGSARHVSTRQVVHGCF